MSNYRDKDKFRNNNYNNSYNSNYNKPEVDLPGTRVEVKNNDLGKALRRFKKKLQEDGIFQLLKERQHFEKPSVKRKKAKAAARSRWLKKLAKDKDM